MPANLQALRMICATKKEKFMPHEKYMSNRLTFTLPREQRVA